MQPPSPTPNHHQLTPSPPFNQDNNANANANINTDMDLNKLLIDTFNKVGRASGAGGLESSKWAVNGGESESWYRTRARLNQARQEQQLLQQTQGQRQRQTTIIRNGARTIGAGQGRRILQQQQQQQQQSHLGECRVPSSSNKGMNGNNGVVSTTTAGSTPTKVLRVKDVGMAVDMSSLHSVMRQCIDPGLERIVDVWVVGEKSMWLIHQLNDVERSIGKPHYNPSFHIDKQSDTLLIAAGPVA
ncbi:hypothetical protein AJ79_03788 [Helicocarpus griseus UAMH5409]|uniref:Uncharacterized protein n=1 Tax=Helicocarpus griseus UAMH5409 TaxID=1447875 RepID=A0A2B7XW49_9EURO|nr:hypothetical protein AJ79_03788 [Helicocarpus griseus UAMH5409]